MEYTVENSSIGYILAPRESVAANDVVGNINSTLYVVVNTVLGNIALTWCYDHPVKASIAGSCWNDVKASIVVTEIPTNDVTGNICYYDVFATPNDVKACIAGNLDNYVYASISAPSESGQWVLGRIDEISCLNDVCANIQLASALIPDTVKNITIGKTEQPGVLTVYDPTEQVTTVASGVVTSRGIEYNARSYKAIITTTSGTEGSFTNFQEAINYVNSLGGGDVLVTEGLYTMASGIVLYDDIRLIGQAYQNTILNFAHGNYNITCSGTATDYRRYIGIENVTISGARCHGRGVIDFSYCQDVRIKSCYFVDNYDSSALDVYDIILNDSIRAVIERNQQRHSYKFISASNSTYIYAIQNIANNAYGPFFSAYNVNDFHIDSNHFGAQDYVDVDAGMINFNWGGRGTISNNGFADTLASVIYFQNGGECQIVSNEIVSGGGAAYNIWIVDSSRFTITGNFLKVAQGNAILCTNSDYIATTGNVFTDNNIDYAFEADADCDRVLLVGNVFYHNPGGGWSNSSTNAYTGGNTVNSI
jgi:hypothetical protein